MKRAFIIHGWDGYPEEGWFPWLKGEMESQGFEVFVPQMPKPDEPRIKSWVPALAAVVGVPDQDTYFVGHSMGCQTIIRYLETLGSSIKVGGAVFVAGFLTRLSNLEDDDVVHDVAKEWLETPIDLEKVKINLSASVAIFSDNDPYVPIENQTKFKSSLGSSIKIMSKQGHFSGTADHTKELPAVLTALDYIINK